MNEWTKINIMKETKYLGMVMDEHLTFKKHIDTVKLNGLQHCHYVNPILLRTLYYAIFESHLQYEGQLWRQTQVQVSKKLKIQKKALRIINLKTQENQVKKYIKNLKF